MVIVDKRHRSYGLVLTDLPLFLDQRVANEVAHGFGAVHVALLGDKSIETLEETLVGGDAESDNLGHEWPPLYDFVPREGMCRGTNRAGSNTVVRMHSGRLTTRPDGDTVRSRQ